MGLTLNRENGKLKISDLEVQHNHVLQTPETCHLMLSQRKISEVQALEIEMADATGIQPRIAHELAGRHVGGTSSLGYTCQDLKNYLRTKRQKELKYGEAGSLVNYFENKAIENPSFKYALQFDKDEQVTNIFWADAKMVIDYAHFGDVVTFDTTFGTNRESRPFGVFVGFNYFRETVVFGAALMYDETFDSFRWLFDAFLKCHNHKQPRTIYTDQDAAMGKAIQVVFSETWHGLCTWHIMQNAIKHLSRHKVDGSNVLAEFSACMYEYEDVPKFEEVFEKIRSKVRKETWLDSIYKHKHKWAECFMKNVYTLGMRSTQLSERLNSDLKSHLNSQLNIVRFFNHFERVVQLKRDKEINSEYESRKKLPRILMRTSMILQASKLYTPQIFEAFQIELERSMSAYTKALDEEGAYIVGIRALDEEDAIEEEYMVLGNHLESKVACTCKQFERVGILCSHALKILDVMNIKKIPEHYVLKQWTREARCGVVRDTFGRHVLEDPKLDASRRFKCLTHRLTTLASRAADFEDCYMFMDSALDDFEKQLEERIQANNTNQPNVEISSHVPENHPHVPENLSCATGLKKKKTQSSGSKRKKNWVERLSKRTKQKTEHQSPPEGDTRSEATQSQALVHARLKNDKTNNQDYEFIGSYTQLLMGNLDGHELHSEGSL